MIVANQLPQRVIDQHGLTLEQWEERVTNAWSGQKGVPPQTAIMDYLNIAQDLEQYGITYFEITNKKGTRLWLGVHNLGMDIYEYSNKVCPAQTFSALCVSRKRLTVRAPMARSHHVLASLGARFGIFRSMTRSSPLRWSARMRRTSNSSLRVSRCDCKVRLCSVAVFTCSVVSCIAQVNKRILALCVGNHFFFISRRRAQANGELVQEDRATLEAKLRKTKEQLLAIRMDLEKVKDASKITKEDQEHEKREAEGMDKFKTMKKAQAGDAKRRIADFEDLEEAEC